jgi:predicted ArsR family transcriptional regulator
VARAEHRKEITDVRVLSALAHPVRLQLLGYLLEMGPRTATECSAEVDATPSACSYHLRHLERFGLVERADSDGRSRERTDGRERLWRASATGFSFGKRPSESSAAVTATQQALTAARIDDSARLAHQFLERSADTTTDWLDASAFATYGLAVTPAELADLVAGVDRLLRPYIAATRVDPPEGSRPVHVTVQAFPRAEGER